MSKTMNQVIADLNKPRLTHRDRWLQSMHYLLGDTAPNYPVPAIRLEVDICQTWDKTVCIFDLDKNDIVYGVYEGDFN